MDSTKMETEALIQIAATFENLKTLLRSKNSADKLQTLKRYIQALTTELSVFGKVNHSQFLRSQAMEGYLALLSAKMIPVSLIEKRNILQIAFNKLMPHAMSDECLYILLKTQNLLCYYLLQLDQISLARDILESMEDLYDKISKAEPRKFYDIEDMFTVKPINEVKRVRTEKIDKVITNNIQMQAFSYNKLNIPSKYTVYTHTALRRQLEMKEGTPQDWAMRTARLGNYFTYLNQLGNARHHLSTAYHVLRTCHDHCKLVPEEFVLQKADFENHFLELSHDWVKYGLALFKLSKKRVLDRYFTEPNKSRSDLWRTVDLIDEINEAEHDDENQKDKVTEKTGKGDYSVEKLLTFTTLDVKNIEAKVPKGIITNVEEARKLFGFTHKWLMRAKHYYDFEHHSAQYISCSLQLAELYEHLAFFETDIDNQYSIQKRRADVLEVLNAMLKNGENVMSVQIDVIRELSQVQLELMALNLQKLWREESQMNIINADCDTESILNSLDSESHKTLTEKTLCAPSKNLFLKKMEATSAINGKLFRLSGQLCVKTPSEMSLSIASNK